MSTPYSIMTEKQTKKLVQIFRSKKSLNQFKNVDDLRINGYMDGGAFSSCYSLGENMVIKSNKGSEYDIKDDGNSFWISKSITANSIHAPKIYFYIEKDGYYLTVMERLEGVTKCGFNAFLRYIKTKLMGKPYGTYEKETMIRSLNEFKHYHNVKTANRMVNLLKNTGYNKEENHYVLDIARRNVMQRKDGTIVILDPFGS